MTETWTRINGPDNNGIYGILRAEETPRDRLVVHLHGMTHYMNQLLEVTSRDFFVAHGFDHYRIGFYDFPKDSRKLSNSTLSTHARDIQAVLDHFKEAGYKQIFVTAHSLAALTMMISNPSGATAVSLWDPSTDVTNFWETNNCLTPHEDGEHYLMDYGSIFWLHKDMVEENKLYPHAKCQELVGRNKIPSQMIAAEKGIFTFSPGIKPEDFIGKFGGDFELQKIAGANHTFSLEGNREELFIKTLNWFQKYSLS
ncbi:MAG: alpha/beta hydrolase [Bdellovibrionales bacterium]